MKDSYNNRWYGKNKIYTTTYKETLRSTSSRQDKDWRPRHGDPKLTNTQHTVLKRRQSIAEDICVFCSKDLKGLDKIDYTGHILSCLDLIVSNGLPSCASWSSKPNGLKNMTLCPICKKMPTSFSTNTPVEKAKHIRRCSVINGLDSRTTWEICCDYWMAERTKDPQSSTSSNEYPVKIGFETHKDNRSSRLPLSLNKGKEKSVPKRQGEDVSNPIILVISDSEDDASDKDSTYSQELDDIRNAHIEKSAFNVSTYRDSEAPNSPSDPKLGDKRPFAALLGHVEEQCDGDESAQRSEKRTFVKDDTFIKDGTEDTKEDHQEQEHTSIDTDNEYEDTEKDQGDSTTEDDHVLAKIMLGERDNNTDTVSSQGCAGFNSRELLKDYAARISSDETVRQAAITLLEKALFASKEDSSALLHIKHQQSSADDSGENYSLILSELNFMQRIIQNMQNEEKRIGLYWVYDQYAIDRCSQTAIRRLMELDGRFARALCIMGILADNLPSNQEDEKDESISIASEPSTIGNDSQMETGLEYLSSSLSLYDLTDTAQQSPFRAYDDLTEPAQQSPFRRYEDPQNLTQKSMQSSQASLDANDVPDIFFSIETDNVSDFVRGEMGSSERDPIEISSSCSSDSNPDDTPQRPQQQAPNLSLSSQAQTQAQEPKPRQQRKPRVSKMPDYANMTEPQLKQHCDRVGLKYQGRKNTVPMLEKAWRHQHPPPEENV